MRVIFFIFILYGLNLVNSLDPDEIVRVDTTVIPEPMDIPDTADGTILPRPEDPNASYIELVWPDTDITTLPIYGCGKMKRCSKSNPWDGKASPNATTISPLVVLVNPQQNSNEASIQLPWPVAAENQLETNDGGACD